MSVLKANWLAEVAFESEKLGFRWLEVHIMKKFDLSLGLVHWKPLLNERWKCHVLNREALFEPYSVMFQGFCVSIKVGLMFQP